jgi:hypothetical protein
LATVQQEFRCYRNSNQVSVFRAIFSKCKLTTHQGAEKLYHIFRTPTWVVPPRIQAWKIMGQAGEILSKIGLDAKENFSEETIEKFKADPEFYREFVKKIEVEVNNAFPIVSEFCAPRASRKELLIMYPRFSQTARCKLSLAARSWSI